MTKANRTVISNKCANVGGCNRKDIKEKKKGLEERQQEAEKEGEIYMWVRDNRREGSEIKRKR